MVKSLSLFSVIAVFVKFSFVGRFFLSILFLACSLIILNLFKGDQSYILIEEMLTRQLLALDGVDSQGNEDVRLTRRSIVRQVQGLISTLESKART